MTVALQINTAPVVLEISGAQGAPGISDYALWLSQPGNAGKAYSDYFTSVVLGLQSEMGSNGIIGSFQHPTGVQSASAGQTTITVMEPVSVASTLTLIISGLVAKPDVDYTVNGTTTVTLTTPLAATDSFWFNHTGGTIGLGLLPGVTTPEANWQIGDLDWTNAWARAFATGKHVIGNPTTTYPISAALILPTITSFENATFAWNGNDTTYPIILSYNGSGSCIMTNIKVILNGNGSGGSLAAAAVAWIVGAKLLLVNGFEVDGQSAGRAGTGIRYTGVLKGEVNNAYIHDITSGTTTSANPGDGNDQICGVWNDGSSNVVCRSLHVENLLTRWSGQSPVPINTRGYALSGPTTPSTDQASGACIYGYVRMVDEAYDLSGGQQPWAHRVVDCTAVDCSKFGFKAAVTVDYAWFVRCRAIRVAHVAFVASNMTGASPSTETQGVIFDDCLEEDTGNIVNTAAPNYQPIAFKVEADNASDMSYPRNITFKGCRSLGGAYLYTPFENQGTWTGDGRNICINCTAVAGNYSGGAIFVGFIDGYSLVAPGGDTSIPSNGSTFTTLTWGSATDDRMGLLATGATSALVIPYTSRWLIDVDVCFEQTPEPFGTGGVAASGGSRVVEILINGSTVPGCRFACPPCADTATFLPKDLILDLAAGTTIGVAVQQSSGVALLATQADTTIKIVDMYQGDIV